MTVSDHSAAPQERQRPVIMGDWGTSRMRLFLHDGRDVIDRTDGPGIGMLTEAPIEVLRRAIAPWAARHDPRLLLLCGMAGSRNGLAELPYAPCPAGVESWAARSMTITLDQLRVTLAPGLSCVNDSGAHDVMRGEETQIFGAVALHPVLARGRHCIVLPGTHSKWAMLEDGWVTSFRTFMTGEVFALLRDHSTLMRAGGDDEDRDAGFADGLACAARPGALTGMLFAARSEQLLGGRTRGWAMGYLSGLLIGQEVAEAATMAGGGQIAMIGDPGLTALYRRALQAAGMESIDIDGNASSIAGLAALRDLA